MIPDSTPNSLIYIPYPRGNCLKTIPFTAAHTYIAHQDSGAHRMSSYMAVRPPRSLTGTHVALVWFTLACVASVSFRFHSKERPRKGISVLAARDSRFFPCSCTCAIFPAVFESRSSFFAPKPHENLCYAGWVYVKL